MNAETSGEQPINPKVLDERIEEYKKEVARRPFLAGYPVKNPNSTSEEDKRITAAEFLGIEDPNQPDK